MHFKVRNRQTIDRLYYRVIPNCFLLKDNIYKEGVDMKLINATVYIEPGQEKIFLTIGRELIRATRKEVGNLKFELYRSNSCMSNFVFIEEYKDQTAVIAHRDSEHFQNFLKESRAIQNAPMDVMIFEGAGQDN